MPDRRRDRELLVVLGVLALFIVAYSFIIVQQVLLGVLAAAGLFLVYLFWRLIRALERIARSLERRSQRQRREERGTRGEREVGEERQL